MLATLMSVLRPGSTEPRRVSLLDKYRVLLMKGDAMTVDELLEAERLRGLLRIDSPIDVDAALLAAIHEAGRTLKALPKLKRDADTAEVKYRQAFTARAEAIAKAEADFAAARADFETKGGAMMSAQQNVRDALRYGGEVHNAVREELGLVSAEITGGIRHPSNVIDEVESIDRHTPITGGHITRLAM